jgi:ribosome biogenesis GTPase
MHPLPDGGYVVDTPGLREVGIWGVDGAMLAGCFPEFRAGLGECKFRDCRHIAEPGCAVRALVASGVVSAERYDSYVRLLAEVEEGGS